MADEKLPHAAAPAASGAHPGHDQPGHKPAGGLLPSLEDPTRHAFVMLGRETLFLVHMTMFDMESHCFQFVLEVELPREAMDAYLAALDGPDAPTFFLGNAADDQLCVPEIAAGWRDRFKADIFRDIPHRKKEEGWPWRDTDRPAYLLAGNVEVQVRRIVLARHFDFGLQPPRHLTYFLFGRGREAHMTNFQTQEPDFDHVLSLERVPDWLPPPYLVMGIHVSLPELSGRPAAPPGTYCANPLPPDGYGVLYYGQGDARLPLQVGRTWWCTTAVVNSSDPCAAPAPPPS